MVTKYYVDCFEYDPWTDKNTMYASVADDYSWFDSWPGVKELPHWERPLKLTFGDDEVNANYLRGFRACLIPAIRERPHNRIKTA